MGLFGFGKKTSSNMNWIELSDMAQLEDILTESADKPVMLFKHSIRCSISSMAKDRIESDWDLDDQVTPVYIDLINYRAVSNSIADKYNVEHQSPQLLLIKNGQCTYSASHSDIRIESLKKQL